MPRVPTYDGPQIAERPLQPVLQGPVDASSGTRALGQAFAGLGDKLDQAQAEQRRLNDRAQAEQRRLDERMRTAQAALAMATTTNALHDAHDQIGRQVAAGEILPDQATPEFRKQATKIVGDTLDGRDLEQRAAMGAHFEQIGGTLTRSLQRAAGTRKQQDMVAGLDQFGEEMQRVSAREGPDTAAWRYNSMVDFVASTVGMPADQAARLKQSFLEKTTANFYQLAGTAAFTNNDDATLGRLVDRIKSPAGDAMDPQRRAVLTHELYGWQQAIVAKKLRAQNQVDDEARRRYNEAAEVINKALDLGISGAAFDKDFISEVVTKAQGTGLEGFANAVMSGQTPISGFASKPADQRAELLNRLRNERGTQGTNPISDRVFSVVETTQSKLSTLIADSPWATAQKVGVIPDAQILNATNPQSAIAIVQRRMQDIAAVERWAGQKVSPLQPQEVVQVGNLVRSLSVDQAATMLSSLGSAVGDADRVAVMGRQMHDKDGSLGLAMMYAGASTTQGRQVAELVLKGDQALRDKSVMVDKAAETGWQGAIAKAIRGAFSSREAEDAYVEAAFKIAAAKYAENGSVDIANAVKLATGGIVERNGQKVPLPWGMKEDDFDRRIEAIKAPDIAAQAPDGKVLAGSAPMSLDQFVASLPKATLVHAGQGLYNVRAGTGLVTNSAGRRITIKVAP
jgi:hypothetical protein